MAKDKLLFAPGPLNTSEAVKSKMVRDVGSHDDEFIKIVREIREQLMDVASLSQEEGYEVVLMQGSGTFGIESVIGSGVPRDGNLMVVVNGTCAERVLEMTDRLRIRTVVYRTSEKEVPNADELDRRLAESRTVTNVHIVHCEATSGILNPIEELAPVVKRHRKTLSVDGVSTFGAIPIDIKGWGIDYLITSSNGALEGVPGLSVIFARRAAMERCEGRARSLSLDLYDQWRELERNGRFRFTPPTHVLLAFREALREFEEEGGTLGRGMRYHQNQVRLVAGMRALGFETYVTDDLQSNVITTFRHPDDAKFDFDELRDRLYERGFVIYPVKLGQESAFRIGSKGQIHEEDVEALLHAIKAVVNEMGVQVGPPQAS